MNEHNEAAPTGAEEDLCHELKDDGIVGITFNIGEPFMVDFLVPDDAPDDAEEQDQSEQA